MIHDEEPYRILTGWKRGHVQPYYYVTPPLSEVELAPFFGTVVVIFISVIIHTIISLFCLNLTVLN